jgi:hypothetical protein
LLKAEGAAGGSSDLPQLVKDEFDAFIECGILAQGFLLLRCRDCGHDKLVALTCNRRGLCPSFGMRRMVQAGAHQVHYVIPQVPVRQRVLSLSIPLWLLLRTPPALPCSGHGSGEQYARLLTSGGDIEAVLARRGA